ncbi:hypothetical protein M0805_006197 [Coniferiporia weirii]|nr:hypothetical protein M0805_006197 [Coniferiporia weirii]
MKNAHNDTGADPQAPPAKRIKLEQDLGDEGRLLSSSMSAPPGWQKKKSGKKTSKGPKSTLEERALLLLQDSRISAVEPQQVMCRMCGHWVKLFKHTDFSPANWRTHAEKCELRTGWKARVQKEPGDTFTLTIPGPNPASTSAPPATTFTAEELSRNISTSHSKELLESGAPPASRRSVKSTADRQRLLDLDVRAKMREPHRVLCALCGIWVKLHNTREYDLWNWQRHAEKCELKFGLPTATAAAIDDRVSSAAENPVVPPSGSGSAGLASRASTSETLGSSVIAQPEIDMIMDDMANSRKGETRNHIVNQSTTSFPASASLRVKSEPDDLELLYPASAENEHEESVSTAIGAKRKKGRSLEERRQSLMDDPRCGEVRPHDVFCLMCKKWIKLYKDVAYIESNWTRHAERCSLRTIAQRGKSKSGPSASSASRPTIPTPLTTLALNSAPPSGGSATSKRLPLKTSVDRFKELWNDDRTTLVEPNQVLCGLCNQWIKLQVYRDYDTWNWRKHIPLCEQRHSSQRGTIRPRSGVKLEEKEAGSSTPVETAPVLSPQVTAPSKLQSTAKAKDESTPLERRDELMRDGRCERIEPHRVVCKLCSRQIGLHTKKDYSLANWYKHVASCSSKIANAKPAKAAVKTPLTALGILRPAKSVPEPISAVPAPSDTIDLTLPMEPATNKQEASSIYTATQIKNAEERRLKLLADPRVDGVEPNRVHCKLCQRWMKLSNDMEYAPYNWYKHIQRCEGRTRIHDQGTSASPIIVKEEEAERTQTQEQTPEEQQTETAHNSVKDARKRHTAAERLARLRTDLRIKTIEKHRAQCGLCEKWVKLQNKTEYDPHNWLAHVGKCELKSKPSGPRSARVQAISAPAPERVVTSDENDLESASCSVPAAFGSSAEDRRMLLVSDVRSVEVEPHRVLCGICQQWIKLRDGKEYVPYNWFKHKGKCERKHGLTRTEAPDVPIHNPDPAAPAVKEEPAIVDLALAFGPRGNADEEREAQLRADPRQAGVEPGRVYCRMCNNWIKLNAATGYLSSNWQRHAQRCQRKTNWKGVLPSNDVGSPELQAVEVIDLELEDSDNGVFGYVELGHLISALEPSVSSTDYGPVPKASEPGVAPKETPTFNIPTLRARTNTPTLPSHVYSEPKVTEDGKRMHRTEEFRKEELKNDPRTSTVLPDKILCGMCGRWIQMRRDVAYSAQNWLKHAGICEVRSGWLQNVKAKSPPKGVLSVSRSINNEEESIPYNARTHMEVDEEPIGSSAPKFKPVNWEEEVVFSDDEEEVLSPAIPPAIELPAAPLTASLPTPSETPAPAPVKSEEPSDLTSVSLNNKEPNTVTVPALPALPHTSRDMVSNPGPNASVPAKRQRKQPSKSPSASAPTPFTTVPLIRSVFTPPGPMPIGTMAQPAHMTNSLSPFLGNKQVANINTPTPVYPQVMPEPRLMPVMGMLPHLLPKSMTPVYGHVHASPSSFLPSTTPPTPSVFSPLPVPGSALPTPPVSGNPAGSPIHSPAPDAVTHCRPAYMASLTQDGSQCAPAYVPNHPPAPEPLTSITAYGDTVMKSVESRETCSSSVFALPSQNLNYKPVKPGVLQLAPLPKPTTQFNVQDVEMRMERDADVGKSAPVQV